MNEHQIKRPGQPHDCHLYRQPIGLTPDGYSGVVYLQCQPSTLAQSHPVAMLAVGLSMLLSKAASLLAYQCRVCGHQWHEGPKPPEMPDAPSPLLPQENVCSQRRKP